MIIYVCIHRVYYMYYVHNPIPLIFNTPILWSQCGNPRLNHGFWGLFNLELSGTMVSFCSIRA